MCPTNRVQGRCVLQGRCVITVLFLLITGGVGLYFLTTEVALKSFNASEVQETSKGSSTISNSSKTLFNEQGNKTEKLEDVKEEFGEGSEARIGRMVAFTVKNLDGEGESNKFLMQTRPDWAPIGVQRFEEMTESNFWSGVRFFRVIDDFIAQFGISGDPSISKKFRKMPLKDDPVNKSNKRGTVSFATSGSNSRTTQLFINLKDNEYLDAYGFSPIGKIVKGMDVVDRIYSEYGESAPRGNGPIQGQIQSEGNVYLEKDFPKLSYIKKARFKS